MREDPGLRVQAEHGRRRGRQERQQQHGVRARQGPGVTWSPPRAGAGTRAALPSVDALMKNASWPGFQ